VETPLVIDAYDPNEFSVSALATSGYYGRVTDPSSNMRASWIEGRTPLVAEGVRFHPSARNRYAAGDKVALYVEIYEPLLKTPDPATPVVVGQAFRIVDRKTGVPKIDSGIQRIPLGEARGNPVIPVAINVPVEGLAPGAYRLEFDAGNAAGKTSMRMLDFEIE
jgi:hypothetical protein